MARDIWSRLATRPESGGIWQRAVAAPRPMDGHGLNVWTTLGNRPGGMWHDVTDETLLLRAQGRRDLWREVNDETLIIRPQRDLWRALELPPEDGRRLGLWAELGGETLVVARPKETVWSAAGARNYTAYRPARRLGWALKRLETARGEEYYILKNLRAGTYLRLSAEQVFLWDLMDGEHTIQDMAVAYFVRYQSLAIVGLLTFLGQLEAQGFLAEPRVNVYAHTAAKLGQGRLQGAGRRLWRALTQTTFSIRGIDTLVGRAYKAGGFLLFARPVQWAMLAVTAAGLVAFAYQLLAGRYSVIRGGGQYVALGLVALYLAQFVAVFLHEAAHALTCKHYRREVRRAGFMLYLGSPAFFVDTTDIWMEPRRPRILVSAAGPYSGFFLASVASLLIFAVPSPFVGGLLYQFAFACNLLSFTNLNPLLQLDGYYILMDRLEIPMLRARALRFVQGDLWRKLGRREPLGREERVYAVFGLLALGWTALALFSMFRLLGGTLLRVLQALLGPGLGLAAMAALAVGAAVLLLWPFVHGLAARRRATPA